MRGTPDASRSEKAYLMATAPNSQLREIGFILIREGALLPPNLTIEREAFLPGWHLVKNLDGYTLNRKIKEANWNFVHLAGDYKASRVGRAYAGVLRSAVKRILTELRGGRFNSLEITVVGLKRFIGF